MGYNSGLKVLMFIQISVIIFFPHIVKCGMYVRYGLSDDSRKVFIIRILVLHFQITPDLNFKPVCISSSNFGLGFGTCSSLLRNICSVEGSVFVLFQ